jgi:glutamate transport system substrate-binding protein
VRIPRLAGVLGGLVLALTGCLGADDPNLLDVEAADFPTHSTMYRLADAGSITVGITGTEQDADSAPQGFEVELAVMIAGALGIPDHAVTWVQTEATEHERLIEDGFVDIVLAAFPIGERSRLIVDFAGPYHVGGAALLAPARGAAGPPAVVCATPDVVAALPEEGYDEVIRARYADCVEHLESGRVEAVIAPDLVVVPELSERFTLAGDRLTSEPYGVGLAKGDDEFRGFLNDILQAVAADGRWDAAWESTAGTVLGPAEPPPVDRY